MPGEDSWKNRRLKDSRGMDQEEWGRSVECDGSARWWKGERGGAGGRVGGWVGKDSEMRREECCGEGGRRGEQQVVCIAATFCSSGPRTPRGNKKWGRWGAKEEEESEGTTPPAGAASLNRRAFILKPKFTGWLSAPYKALKYWKACLWVECNPFSLVSQKCIWLHSIPSLKC